MTEPLVLDPGWRRALFDQWQAFARHVARRIWNNPEARRRLQAAGRDFDDAVQLALMGMWHATGLFDPGRGFKFGSYAYRACLSFALARADGRRPFVALGDIDPPMRTDADLRDAVAVEAEAARHAEDLARVRKAAEELPPAVRAVFLRRLDGLTVEEVAAERGLTSGTVRTYCTAAVRRVRRILRRRAAPTP